MKHPLQSTKNQEIDTIQILLVNERNSQGLNMSEIEYMPPPEAQPVAAPYHLQLIWE